jgi:histo-blood group ABO system transferase
MRPTSATTRPSIALVTVASGERYVRYARRMLESAATFFLSDAEVEPMFLLLEGREGWPAATMERYHVILEHADRLAGATHVFHVDCDMLFVAPVGSEILGPLVATQHPGYVGRRGTYEDRPASAAYVAPDEGSVYHCGGFSGGEKEEFLRLAESIRDGVDSDARRGITARWHDESHLNRYLVDRPPDVTLSPSYCYPEDDAKYIEDLWPERYVPRLVALSKPRQVQWAHHRLRRVLRRRG